MTPADLERELEKARQVEVDGRIVDDAVELRVRDDGTYTKGADGASPQHVIGMQFMEEQVHSIGGSLAVQSNQTDECGTSVTIRLPLTGPSAA